MDSIEEVPSIEVSVNEKPESNLDEGSYNDSDDESDYEGEEEEKYEEEASSKDVESSEQSAMSPDSKSEEEEEKAKDILGMTSDTESDDDSDSDIEDNLKKFDDSMKKNIIDEYHKDLHQSNYDEITALSRVIRDENGNVVDNVHKTLPFLTKFERARVLGLRAKQLNSGADPFIDVPEHVIEGHIIAEMELEKKKLPFIISRPLPNGKKEYWKLADLELIEY